MYKFEKTKFYPVKLHSYFTGVVFLLAGFLLLPNFVSAAPSVSSTSGSFTHGQSVTVSGSGFGVKNPVAPQVWADFSNGLAPSNLSLASLMIANAVNTTTTFPSTGYPPRGAAVTGVKFGGQPYGGETSEIGANAPIGVSGGWTRLYNYVKRYWSWPTGAGENQKSWRMYTADYGVSNADTRDVVQTNMSGDSRIYVENSGDVGSINYYGADPADTSQVAWSPPYNGSQTTGWGGSTQGQRGAAGQWNIEEFLWDYGTGGADGTWYHFLNGAQNQYRSAMTNGTGSSVFSFVFLSNYCTPGACLAPPDARIYMADYYIDTTYARVMIGNASTLAASTHREIQIPKTQWIDGQLQIQINQGSFANNSTAYLFVVDNNNVSSSGYPITFGSGVSDTTAPSAPQGLSVQ